jgi:hypothetical protein
MMTPPADKPDQPPQWSSNYFGDAAAAQGLARMDRGMVDHVPIVAALLMVQGALEIVFAISGFGFVALAYLGPEKEFAGIRGLAILMAIISVPALLAGVLQIIAGVFNLRYRRRGLGIAALATGLLALVTGYCAPSAIALAIYGLIVYLNEPVAIAFSMGDGGQSPGEIRGAFLPRI